MAPKAGDARDARRSSGSSSRRTSRAPTDYPGGFPNPDDFCNSFWDDAGYDALTARMRQSSKTLDELRAFYKEKAAIEEDYGKKMNKLARQTLGKNEMGNLRLALDRLRQECARTADSHEKLAAGIRNFLVADLKRFDASREDRRKGPQAAVEKAYKEKSRQEGLSSKAKEKYKSDCISINGLTAQTSLTQGRDLDRVQQKLEKHEATVQVNRSDYEAFSSAYRDTLENWNHEWRSYSDLCQDLEEERMDFLRFSIWDFANAQSLICVTDDESCEEIRRALERFQTAPEVAELARTIGTGAKILDAPAFVDYGMGHHDESGARRYRTANFPRSSTRLEIKHTGDLLVDLQSAIRPSPGIGPPTPFDEYDPRRSSRPQSRTDVRRESQPDLGAPGISPSVSSSGPSPIAAAQLNMGAGSAEGIATPVAPSRQPPALPHSLSSTEQKDVPTQRPPSRGPLGSIGAAISRRLSRGASADKLADVPSQPYSSGADMNQANAMLPTSTSLAVSSSAESASRAAPSTMAAGAFQRAVSSPAAPPVEASSSQEAPASPSKVDSFDNDPLRERLRALRSLSNSQKRTSTPIAAAAAADLQARRSTADLRDAAGQPRPPSRGPTADYGVSDDRRMSRQSSRGIENAARRASVYAGYAAADAESQQPQQPMHTSTTSPALYSQGLPQQRAVSGRPPSQSMGQIAPSSRPQQTYAEAQTAFPASSGIALDSRGQVIQDTLAEEYARRQQQQHIEQQQRQLQSQLHGYPQDPMHRPPVQQPPQGHISPPPQNAYQAPAAAQAYGQRRQSTGVYDRGYDPAPARQQDSFAASQQRRENEYSTSQTVNGYGAVPHPANGSNYPGQRQASPAPMLQPHRGPSPAPPSQAQPQSMPVGRMPPTGQFSEGRPILFYVQALYDYAATIDEEFSFQAGDIIAVFQTDADGWWQGELLDEDRKQIGGNTFPSNFTQLLS